MSISFPAPDDQLFRHDLPDWTNNAVLNYVRGKFPPYANGYREGAKTLINSCLNNRGVNDILIYPIVFLYRQYIELRMKEIIIALKYCNGVFRDFPKHHKIDQVWYELKKEYQQTGELVSDGTFENAERVILEFSRVDPTSMAFRYPLDKSGNNTTSLTHINIRNFGEVMERLACFLDALSDQAAHFEDIAIDMYNELYAVQNENY